MITSGAPGVCYRCRLRRLRPPPQSFLTASSRALGGRPPILRSFSNSSTARSYGGPNPFDEDYNEKPRIVRYDGKKHVSRDRLLEERSARLNSNMLGKPAYAIVMRDRGIRNRRQPSPVPDDDVYAPEPTSIGDLLNNRGRRMTAEEVRDSINSLRPIGETAMSESAFRKLQESLANGFLTVHLQDYLAYHKRNTLPYQRLLVGEEIAETGEKKPAGKKIEAEQEEERKEGRKEEREEEEEEEDVWNEDWMHDQTVHEEKERKNKEWEEMEAEEVEQDAMELAEIKRLDRGRKKHEKLREDNKYEVDRYGWVKIMTPWVPLGPWSKPGSDTTDFTILGYVDTSAHPKDKLAVRIMRECWDLSIQELDGGLGDTRVRIRTRDFQLLQRGAKRWVTFLGKGLLDPGERMEIFNTTRILRLVTTKPKAAVMLKDLNETFKQVNSRHFPVKLIRDKKFDDEILEEVARITNTYIRQTPNSERVEVTWIHIKTREDRGLVGLEDLRHVVFRLLLRAYGPTRATCLLSRANTDTTTGGHLVADLVGKERLPWNHRMLRMCRFMFPLSSKDGTPPAELGLLDRLYLPIEPMPDDTSAPGTTAPVISPSRLAQVLPQSRSPVSPLQWDVKLKTSTIARFGYLLHQRRPTTKTLTVTDVRGTTRFFAPITPHPLRLAQLQSKDKDAGKALVHNKTTLVLYYWPSPGAQTTLETLKAYANFKKRHRERAKPYISPAPYLELRLAIKDDTVLGVESLTAIKEIGVTEVMLPAALVDIAFTQTRYSRLRAPPEKLAEWWPVEHILKASHIDVARGKFEFPAHQKFPVPVRLFLDSRKDDFNYPAVGGPDSLHAATYTFAGYELRHAVSAPYERSRLTYSSVDAGDAGGRWTEVDLEPIAPPGSRGPRRILMDEFEAETFNDDFLDLCNRFARNDDLWSGGPTKL